MSSDLLLRLSALKTFVSFSNNDPMTSPPPVTMIQAREVRRKLVEHNPYADAISRESVASSRLTLSKATSARSSVIGANKATNRTNESSNNKNTATAIMAGTATAAVTTASTETVGANESVVRQQQ